MREPLIDTHAHIYLDRFSNDRDAMLIRAREAGVGAIVLPAIDVASVSQAIRLSEQHPWIYAMAAIHPSETKEASDDDFAQIEAFTRHPRVIAVGESGLDYYWDRSFDEKQHSFLRKHIQLAIRTDLPLVLHDRQASDDLINIIRKEKGNRTLTGVFHCFGGSLHIAEQIIDLGFLLGIGGTVTFKNSGVAETVRDIPLEHIILETDAPFLAPVPYRGKRNEPAYIAHVADKIAEVKGLSRDEVARTTTDNAAKLFGIERPVL